ncbi:Uncharacterised protein [Serratia fonticola]|nr:Uncharacterised protein [Serratia fonticola]
MSTLSIIWIIQLYLILTIVRCYFRKKLPY